MVIIDTLNRNIGGSESSEDDMGAFIAAADRLRSQYGSTVLVVHHTGWNNERERGHSSLRGAADTMISVAAGRPSHRRHQMYPASNKKSSTNLGLLLSGVSRLAREMIRQLC